MSASRGASEEGRPQSFGAWLKQQRKQRELSQAVLAAQLGYSVALIRALEAGRRSPSEQLLARIIQIWQVSLQTQSLLYTLRDGSPLSSVSVLSSIPYPLTPFYGHTPLVADLITRLTQSSQRLITLTGPPGAGKTRLALHLAQQLDGVFADGVAFIPLTDLQDTELVLPTIAQQLGIASQSSHSIAQVVHRTLQGQERLLILDNFEQLLPATTLLIDLLASVPQITILVTSREILRVSGEYVVDVPPLPLPETTSPLETISANVAVQLFLDRAAAVGTQVLDNPLQLPAIARLCRMLDGLPLAIELVAAHSRLHSPTMLEQMLREGILDLVHPLQQRMSPHLTLREAIHWSYIALNSTEQQLFAQMSVFAGGATMEAVEAICALEPRTIEVVQSALERLIHVCLVQYDLAETVDTSRWVFLNTIRSYALECLQAQGEAAYTALRQRHAQYYCIFVEQATKHLGNADRAVWMARIHQDYWNVEVALTSACAMEDWVLAARIALALRPVWEKGAYLQAGCHWMTRILAHSEELSPVLHASLLQRAGILLRVRGAYSDAEKLLSQSLILYRELADEASYASTLISLGNLATQQGKIVQAETYYRDALAWYQRQHNNWELGAIFNGIGTCAFYQNDFTTAYTYYEQALQVSRQLQNRYVETVTMANLGLASLYMGEYVIAQTWFQSGQKLSQELHEPLLTARLLSEEGRVLCRAGRYQEAYHCLATSVDLWQSLEVCAEFGLTIQNVAELAVCCGAWEMAAWCLGGVESLQSISKVPLCPAEQTMQEALQQRIQDYLNPPLYAVAWQTGIRQPHSTLIGALQRKLVELLPPKDTPSPLADAEQFPAALPSLAHHDSTQQSETS